MRMPDVPRFPVVVVQVKEEGGQEAALYDGSRVQVPSEQEAMQHLLDMCSDKAGQRPCKAIRVVAIDVDGVRKKLVVDSQGNFWPVDDPEEQQTSRAGKQETRRNKVFGALAGALVVVLSSGAFIGWKLHGPEDPGPPEPVKSSAFHAQPGESPVVPVQGLSRRARWVSQPIGFAHGEPPLLVRDSSIWIVTKDSRKLQLEKLRAKDGYPLLRHELPGSVTGKPFEIKVSEREHIGIVSDGKLLVFDQKLDVPAKSYPIPKGSEAVESSSVPLFWSKRKMTAWTLVNEEFVSRVLPAGAVPLWAKSSGEVIAADKYGSWWKLTQPTTAPSPGSFVPPHPDASPVELLGVADGTVIVTWLQEKDDLMMHSQPSRKTWVAGYNPDDGIIPLWQHEVDSRYITSRDFSVSGSWVILGNYSVDVKTGHVNILPKDWRTTRITKYRAWSYGSHPPQTVTPGSHKSAPVEATLKNEMGIPWDFAEGLGLVVAGAGMEKKLYALEPDTGPYEAAIPTAEGSGKKSSSDAEQVTP